MEKSTTVPLLKTVICRCKACRHEYPVNGDTYVSLVHCPKCKSNLWDRINLVEFLKTHKERIKDAFSKN